MANEKILVVDDEEIICMTIKAHLKKNGFQVDTVLSGEEAIEKLENHNDYALVITDLMMYKKTGVDVIKKAHEINVNIPVIVMTGYGHSPLLDEAMREHPCGNIFKPCSNNELLQVVLKCLAG